ncbi:MAG TPA: rhodanese-like domain-containing protein, partial [Steroidobacteraceae bacterium]|nr:rhodanese-like domain-containing protein [Steroidobacteraceae bacterium]
SPFGSALRIEVEMLEQAPPRFPSATRVVLCCRSGVRAWRAAQALRNHGHEKLALIAMGE